MQNKPNKPSEDRETGPEEWHSLELIASQVEKQLDIQWELWDVADGRIRLLLGFVGAVFVAVLAFVADRAGAFADVTVGLVVAAVITLIFSGLIATAAWLPREFNRPPRPSTLRDSYLTRPARETLLEVVDTMIKYYTENEPKISEKLAAFRRAAYLLGLAIIMIAVAALVELLR